MRARSASATASAAAWGTVRSGNALDSWLWYIGARFTRFKHQFLDKGNGDLGKGWRVPEVLDSLNR